MGYTCKLEERELHTIADLLEGELEREKGDGGGYYRRSLVRLALVLSNLTPGYGRWKRVIHDAPDWVYAYLGKPIIELAAPAKPKARPVRRRPKAHATVSRRASSRSTSTHAELGATPGTSSVRWRSSTRSPGKSRSASGLSTRAAEEQL